MTAYEKIGNSASLKSAIEGKSKSKNIEIRWWRWWMWTRLKKLNSPLLIDCKSLIELETLPPHNNSTFTSKLNSLRLLLADAEERDKQAALEKLRQLGDQILYPFGLSTSMFKQNADGSGGYTFSTAS